MAIKIKIKSSCPKKQRNTDTHKCEQIKIVLTYCGCSSYSKSGYILFLIFKSNGKKALCVLCSGPNDFFLLRINEK